MRPTTRRKESSGMPGHVFAVGSATPCARPLRRFFCIRLSFAMKYSADWMGYDFVKEDRWGSNAVSTV